MALSEQQIKELKTQLFSQIKDLPADKKAQAEEQINSLSEEALEGMLSEQRSQSKAPKVFRLIIEKEIPSVIIEENPSAIAVLSTKSISKGHTIIIPKSPITNQDQFPKEIHSFSEKISKKIINSLKSKSTLVLPEKNFGEVIINIIPIYDQQLSLSSPRKDIPIEELEKIKTEINIEIIQTAPKEKIKIKRQRKAKPLKLPRRIP